MEDRGSMKNKEGDILRTTGRGRRDMERKQGRTESWTVRGEGEEQRKQYRKERASDSGGSIEIGETKSAKGGGNTKD